MKHKDIETFSINLYVSVGIPLIGTRVYPFNLSICLTNGLNMFTGSKITVIVITKF